MRRLSVALTITTLLLAGCQAPGDAAQPPATSAPSASGSLLQQLGVTGSDATSIIDSLEASSAQRPIAGLKASVRADRLVLDDGTGERSLPIPEDKFYLSIAPYLERTHECSAHSLSGCQGELVGKQVKVTIVDDKGETLVDKQVTTQTNGFVGFWLPRDIRGRVTATMDGHTGTANFATTQDSATCLTTLQMV